MAPPSPNWQQLLRIQPSDIDVENGADEERNEKLGVRFIDVGMLRETVELLKIRVYSS